MVGDYNYDHFRTKHLLTDAVKTIAGVGQHPVATATLHA